MQVITVGGRKARYRRGGFPTREAAAGARRAVLDGPVAQATAGAWTVARWLRYLIPSLGRITLADLTGKRLQACFDLLSRQRTKAGTPIAASTAALDRDDLDSEARELAISRQLIALPGELYCGPPKSRASIRTIALDEDGNRRLVDQAVELLRHQFSDQRRSDSRVRTGPGWRRGRPMFTYADGRPIRPEY